MIQEYIFEVGVAIQISNILRVGFQRTVKRLHLSKSKTTKYLDSGMMFVFYLISLVMGVDHIIKVESHLIKAAANVINQNRVIIC